MCRLIYRVFMFMTRSLPYYLANWEKKSPKVMKANKY